MTTLTIYIITWIKIWMFTPNLKMKIGIGNTSISCKQCCGGNNKNVNNENNESKSLHIADKDRPLDIISFLVHP